MPSGYVDHGAVISGWPAKIIDQVLSRHLPQYFAEVSPEDLAELKAAHQQIGRARRAYEAGAESSVVGPSEPVSSELPEGLCCDDEISIAEAAGMLAVSQRQVCKLAARWQADGLARRVGRTWLMDRVAVELCQDQRGKRAA